MAALRCVCVYDGRETKASENAAPALHQRAAKGLHVESVGSAVEECQGASPRRSVPLERIGTPKCILINNPCSSPCPQAYSQDAGLLL